MGVPHHWPVQPDPGGALLTGRNHELGVVPDDTELAPWSGDTPHWNELDETKRLVAERLIKTYAAFAEHTDAQVGRLVEFLRESGELDNTLVFYILGDNGASAEGQFTGTFNELAPMNGVTETTQRIADRLDEIGGPRSYPRYPVWAGRWRWTRRTSGPSRWLPTMMGSRKSGRALEGAGPVVR